MMLFKAAPYFTMFPSEFVEQAIAGARPGDWLLDPFSGRGTALSVARSRGLNASGIDASPVAAAYSKAQLADASLEEVLGLLDELLEAPVPAWEPGEYAEFWLLAYHQATFEDLLRVREGLLGLEGDAAALLRLFVLSRLHGPVNKSLTYLSNQMPRTYAPKPAYAVRYWKKRGLTPPLVDVRRAIRRVAERYLESRLPKVGGGVQLGDARTTDPRCLGGPYKFVVTSPPYPGMRTYVPDQWLRNWFLGGPPKVSYSYRGQLSSADPETFVSSMRRVWINAARASMPGARLIVRLGVLPKSTRRKLDPRDLFVESLGSTPWRLDRVEVVPGRTGRQSKQFGRSSPNRGHEYDFYAALRE